jgi:chemotaxis protein CheD
VNTLIVGVADCKLSANPDTVLVTYALGSCIALAIHDPVARIAGLLHFMLPDSEIDRQKAARNPYMFADTGIPLLFRRSYELGAEKRRLIVRAAGGAQVMDAQGIFNIGKRNSVALRKILWKAGLMLHGEAVGGMDSRTVRLEVATGRIWWRGAGGVERELPASVRHAKGVNEWHTVS